MGRKQVWGPVRTLTTPSSDFTVEVVEVEVLRAWFVPAASVRTLDAYTFFKTRGLVLDQSHVAKEPDRIFQVSDVHFQVAESWGARLIKEDWVAGEWESLAGSKSQTQTLHAMCVYIGWFYWAMHVRDISKVLFFRGSR